MSKSLPLVIATLVACLLAPVAQGQVEGVGVVRQGLVIGNDDRQLVGTAWLNANPRYRPLVDAIGRMKRVDGGTFFCTVSYIGGGLALTAGHCVGAGASERHNLPCDNISIEWGLRVDAVPYLTSRCLRILAARKLAPYDYAVLEVSPLPRAEIKGVFNAGSSSGVTSPGTMFSHPGGRQLTWSGTCYLPPFASAVAHRCDSEPGSSGGLILEDKQLLAVGIHYGHSGALNAAIYLAHVPIGDIMEARFRPKGKVVSVGGKCLDVTNRNAADRTPIQIQDCGGGDAQTWSMTPYGTIVGLERKCLDTPYGANGTPTWLFGCHYGPNQVWSFQDAEVRTASTKCLDVPGVAPSNSTPAQVWECHGGAGQKWTWTERRELRNSQGRCLDAASFTPSDGTPVVLYECHGGANQMWDIGGGGSIRGIGGLCVDLPGGNRANGTRLQLHECNGSDAQRWFVRGPIRGFEGKCLDAQSATAQVGTRVVVDACDGRQSQLWNYFP
jgi:hypothetical protein